MESNQNVWYPVITKFLNPKEECLFDRDFDVFDLILNVNDIVGFKNRVIEKSTVQGDAFNLVESGLIHYYLPRVINFLEFVDWCALHYSESQNSIMSQDRTKVLCEINT